MFPPDYYDYGEPQEMTWSYQYLFYECVIPTSQQAIQIVTPLLLLCIGFRLIAYVGFPKSVVHLVSGVSGLCSLYIFFEWNLLHLVYLGIIGYVVLWFLHYYTDIHYKGAIMAVVCVLFQTLWEYFLVDHVQWHRIRGSQLLLAMRIISIAIDLDQGTIQQFPDPQRYLGYCYFVGCAIFGPWLKYQQYCQVEDPIDMNLSWIWEVVKRFVKSVICLNISVCVAPTMGGYGATHKWFLAYQDAMSFRFSHYFISFMAEASCITAGVGFTQTEDDYSWDLKIAKPSQVEMPRSLVEVVTNWNIPMHSFLKNYIFKTARTLGTFPAIILTYAASAILHGLYFQLAAVLLSLGFYTYVEFVLRKKLSEIFNACVLARKCQPNCQHRYKETTIIVFLANLLFGFVAVFHLAYLGVMFDADAESQEVGYTMGHTLSKWSQLDYASHYVVLASYIFYKLI
ncbi:protein-serine O-palmitoleoyltransferase porcupine-like [Glandiceps talaboti]